MTKPKIQTIVNLKLLHWASMLIIVALVFTFTAYGATSSNINTLSQEQSQNEDEAIVYLYRLKSMVGGAVAWTIFIWEYDETKKEFLPKQKIGKLKQKQYMPITIKANTIYYIEVGTMQKILLSGTENANIMVQLKGTGIKVTAKNNYALVKIGSGNIVASTNFAELIVQTGINKSNEKKFVEKKFTLLEPIENNVEYEEMKNLTNCL